MDNYINYCDFDFNVNPLDDFYSYVNGNWIKNNKIPNDYSKWSSFEILREDNLSKLHKIILNSKGKYKILGQLYNEYINVKKRNNIKAKPIKYIIDEISSLKNKDDLWNYYCINYKKGFFNLFYLIASEDAKNSDYVVPHIYAGGLGLPDREYYFSEDKKEHRKKYIEYLENCYKLYFGKNVNMSFILNFEKDLAEKTYTNVQKRNPNIRYNKFTSNEFQKKTNLNWNLFFKNNFKNIKYFIVDNPDYFLELSKLINKYSLDQIKIILQVSVISNFSSYLSDDFYDNKFNFSRKFLSGQTQKKDLWKRAVNFVDNNLGDLLGESYSKKYFSQKSKEKMDLLVKYLINSMKERLLNLDWMTEPTKKKAIEKLKSIHTKIGYPDKWRSYDKINFDKSNNLIEMILIVIEFEFNFDMNRIYKNIDKNRWEMSAHEINAYFHPLRNEIVFPCGILQSPFFNVNADDAINFGGIGCIIGHELTHAFDDKGSLYDKNGNLNNWWSDIDMNKFKQKTKYFIEEYNKNGVNGKLTLGENLADHGGVKVSYYALKQKLIDDYSLNKSISGLNQYERFFISYSSIWKCNIKDSEYKKRLITDVHSPNKYRVNTVLSSIPEFHLTFFTLPINDMYRKKPEQMW